MKLQETDMREKLVSQLAFFDEQLTAFLDRYLPSGGDVRMERERRNTKAFIERYIFKLEQLLLEHAGSEEELCPDFAVIGSKIKVRYEDGYQESYTLCFPEESDPDNSCISFVSPLGSQLLMAEKGSEVTIITPGQITRADIVDVECPE